MPANAFTHLSKWSDFAPLGDYIRPHRRASLADATQSVPSAARMARWSDWVWVSSPLGAGFGIKEDEEHVLANECVEARVLHGRIL